jgi:hypothetical protein
LCEAPEQLFAAPERSLGRPSLGKVAGDVGKTDKISARIADAIDDEARPKPGSILASRERPTRCAKNVEFCEPPRRYGLGSKTP